MKYSLPPEMYETEWDGLFLFFDPVGFVWFQTDAVGKTLIDTLARGGDGQDAAVEVARLSGVPLKIASVYVASALGKLLEMGFLRPSESVLPSRAPLAAQSSSPPAFPAAPFL
jgi:hypothetical protein